MPTEKNASKNYELTFILGEKATAEDGTAKAVELAEYIATQGGKVTKEEHWGRRELAYVIKRNRSGYYVTMWFSMPSDGLKPLDQQLRFDESVIRSLVTAAYTEAQPGSLYPVVEEEKPERGAAKDATKSTAEEMLRRTSGTAPKKSDQAEALGDAIPDEERLKKLDETLEVLLKEEE